MQVGCRGVHGRWDFFLLARHFWFSVALKTAMSHAHSAVKERKKRDFFAAAAARPCTGVLLCIHALHMIRLIRARVWFGLEEDIFSGRPFF